MNTLAFSINTAGTNTMRSRSLVFGLLSIILLLVSTRICEGRLGGERRDEQQQQDDEAERWLLREPRRERIRNRARDSNGNQLVGTGPARTRTRDRATFIQTRNSPGQINKSPPGPGLEEDDENMGGRESDEESLDDPTESLVDPLPVLEEENPADGGGNTVDTPTNGGGGSSPPGPVDGAETPAASEPEVPPPEPEPELPPPEPEPVFPFDNNGGVDAPNSPIDGLPMDGDSGAGLPTMEEEPRGPIDTEEPEDVPTDLPIDGEDTPVASEPEPSEPIMVSIPFGEQDEPPPSEAAGDTEIAAPEEIPVTDPMDQQDVPTFVIDGEAPPDVPPITEMSAPEPEPEADPPADVEPDTPMSTKEEIPTSIQDPQDVVDTPTLPMDGDGAALDPLNKKAEADPEPVYTQQSHTDTVEGDETDGPMEITTKSGAAGEVSTTQTDLVIIGRPGYRAHVCGPSLPVAKHSCATLPVCKYMTLENESGTTITSLVRADQGPCVRRCDIKYGLSSNHCLAGDTCFPYVTQCKCDSLTGEGCQPF